MERKALGRGLGALIPTRSGDSAEQNIVRISSIKPNPFQPREVFAEEAIAELAESIRRKGVLQPLLVRKSGGGYELIAGERRFRAAQKAGLTEVPVVIRDANDDELLEIALIENIQRENLNPLEEARAYRRLIDEFALTQEQVADKVAKDRSTVANTLRLLQLPDEVKEEIARGNLSAGHARNLVNLGSAAEQVAMARDVVSRGLNVRDTEHLVRSHRRRDVDADQRALEERLSHSLGTKVRVHLRRDGRGRLEVQFYSLAELNGLVDRLTETPATGHNF